jgi:sec-independent protein translocase protein TatC
MTDPNLPDSEAPFVSHLMELRDRLLRMVLLVLVVFLALFPFANSIYTYVAGPLMAALPEGTSMIATQVASPFLTPFKLSLVAAVFICMPYLLYQLWAFVAPGLYQHERRLALPLVFSSVILFYLGVAFAYYVVFPLVFGFLTSIAPEGVAVMTDITAYLDFVLTLFFAFGLAFEIPIATIILVWMGITTPEALRAKRPYVIVGAFVTGMLLTPPDVISQTLLALPMWVLFELGIMFAKVFPTRQAAAEGTPVVDEPRPATAAVAASAQPTPSSDMPETWEEGRFVPMTEDEMEEELDRIDAQHDAEEDAEEFPPADEGPAPDESSDADRRARVDAKLARIHELRQALDFDGMRRLLYEVLVEGNEMQINVARNILAQLDDSATY